MNFPHPFTSCHPCCGTGSLVPAGRLAYVGLLALAPAVATKEATDGDSNLLPRKSANATAVAIRTARKLAYGWRVPAAFDEQPGGELAVEGALLSKLKSKLRKFPREVRLGGASVRERFTLLKKKPVSVYVRKNLEDFPKMRSHFRLMFLAKIARKSVLLHAQPFSQDISRHFFQRQDKFNALK